MRLMSKLHGRLCLFVIILPPILSLAYIKLFGVNVVYADEWVFVPLIEKLYTGALTLGDLFGRHNEHRILFPRIITLLLAHLTHYNTLAVMYFSWTLVLITSLLIFKMYRQNFGNSASALLKFAPVAWLLFSFRQYESLLWGFELQVYLCVAGFVASIYMLGKANKYMFLGACCSGIVSTFSFANGLLVWPVGIVFIILSRVREKAASIFLWAFVGLGVWIIYLHDWTTMPRKLDMLFALRNPLAAITFLVLNIGSPLGFVKSSAIGMGAIISIYMLGVLILHSQNGMRENAKWIALILFSLASSFFFTVGRTELGLWAALASRYVPFTVVGIVGVYLAILNFYNKGASTEQRQKYAVLYGAILSIIFVGIVCGYTSGIARGKEIFAARRLMADHLIEYEQSTDKDLQPILYDVDKVRERAGILKKYRLNVFQHGSD